MTSSVGAATERHASGSERSGPAMPAFLGEDARAAKHKSGQAVDVVAAMGKRTPTGGLPLMIRTPLLPLALAGVMIGLLAPQPAGAQSAGASPDVRATRVQYRPVRRPRPRIRGTPAYPYSPSSTPYP